MPLRWGKMWTVGLSGIKSILIEVLQETCEPVFLLISFLVFSSCFILSTDDANYPNSSTLMSSPQIEISPLSTDKNLLTTLKNLLYLANLDSIIFVTGDSA